MKTACLISLATTVAIVLATNPVNALTTTESQCGDANVTISGDLDADQSFSCSATNKITFAPPNTVNSNSQLFLAAPLLSIPKNTTVKKGATVTLKATQVTTNQAQLGSLSGTQINAYQLSDLNTTVEGPIDANSSITDLTLAGSFRLKLQSLPADEWILVTATGGTDLDADDDGVIDSSATPNLGTIHALGRVRDWLLGGMKIGILSEISWQTVKIQVMAGNTDDLQDRLQWAAFGLMKSDLNGDGVINYLDILQFDPLNSAHRTALAFAYQQLLEDAESGSSLVDQIHQNNETELLARITTLFGATLNLPELELMAVNPVIEVPTNRGGITHGDVVVKSLLTGDNQVTTTGATTLVGVDADGNTLLLGYTIAGQPVTGRTVTEPAETALTITRAATPELSPRSTALAMVMMIAGNSVDEQYLEQLATAAVDHDDFDVLANAMEATFQSDPRFLDRLGEYEDLVAMISSIAGNIFSDLLFNLEYTTRQIIESSTSPRDTRSCTGETFWWGSPWDKDEPWNWYGKADKISVWLPPFLAVENCNKTHLAAANPTLLNQSMALYDEYGVTDWFITDRSSTLLQKTINSGAAMRDFYVGDQIPEGTPHVEFNQYRFTFTGDDGAAWVSVFNQIHLAASTFSFVSSAMSKAVKDGTEVMTNSEKAIKVMKTCFPKLLNTMDYHPGSSAESPAEEVWAFISNNGISFLETAVTDCFIPAFSAAASKKLADKVAVLMGTAAAEMVFYISNPVGWVAVVVKVAPVVANDFGPFALSYITNQLPVGYDLTWSGSEITNIIRRDERPQPTGFAVMPPTADFNITANGKTISFDASTSIVDYTANPAYKWGLGDGSLADGIKVEHTYATPGLKNIRLTLYDGLGQHDEVNTTVEVVDGIKPNIIGPLDCKLTQINPAKVEVTVNYHDADDDVIELNWYKNSGSFANPSVTAPELKTKEFSYIDDGIDSYTPGVVVIDAKGNRDAAYCDAVRDGLPNLGDYGDVTAGLVARYEFEGDARDSSGQGNHGTVNGGVTYAGGVRGRSAQLDGSSGEITVTGHNSSFDLSVYSISVWFNSADPYRHQNIVSHGESLDTDKMQYGILFLNDGRAYGWLETDNDSDYRVYSNSSMSPGIWTHAIVTRDQFGSHKIYIDGILHDEQNSPLPASIDHYLTIGYRNNASDGQPSQAHFNGSIDDVRIYDRALDISEVQRVYQYTKP